MSGRLRIATLALIGALMQIPYGMAQDQPPQSTSPAAAEQANGRDACISHCDSSFEECVQVARPKNSGDKPWGIRPIPSGNPGETARYAYVGCENQRERCLRTCGS